MEKSKVIAGLDIGATKVVLAVATPANSGVEVVAIESAPIANAYQGSVVSIEAVSQAICCAKEKVELKLGFAVEEVWVGVSGRYAKCFSTNGIAAIKSGEVTVEDVRQVLETARAVAIPSSQEVLHILPSSYSIDGQSGVLDPVGMSGVRLEASVQMITSRETENRNITRCVTRAGLKASGLVLSQLATATSVLSEGEKQLGVCLVDIGGVSCDLVVYYQGSVIHASSIPVGGNHFDRDIAVGLRVSQDNAEKIKKESASAILSLVGEGEQISIEHLGGAPQREMVLRKDLSEMVEARAEEILHLIYTRLRDENLLQKLGSGVVVSGGSSLLTGFIELTGFLFDMPVRQGLPQKINGLLVEDMGPEKAAVVGLLLYGQQQEGLRECAEESVGEKINTWVHRAKKLFESQL